MRIVSRECGPVECSVFMLDYAVFILECGPFECGPIECSVFMPDCAVLILDDAGFDSGGSKALGGGHVGD